MATSHFSLPSETQIKLQGVFVHPDHLSGFSDEVSSCSSADSSSLISYGTDDDDEDIDMSYRDARSIIQDNTDDYFAPRPRSSNSSFYTDSSDGGASFSSIEEEEEDVATTPTPDSCDRRAAPLSRSSSYDQTYPDLTSSPFPASFAFSTFAPSPVPSRPSSRSASPCASPALSPSRRAHPYAAQRSTAMLRSFSSPVETNREVEQRKKAMLAFTESMDERAKMIRSKSTPNAGMPTPGAGVAMSRSAAASRAPVSAPFLTPFGDDWGSALPPRSPQPSTMLPFPYNLATPPSPHSRLNRANSYAGVENHYQPEPRMEHRNSVPTIAISGPASSTVMRSSSRRSSVLRPLTPIVAQSAEPPTGVCAALESFTFSPSPSSPPSLVRARLHRGLSF
ncbi:uncharacterized protein JCM15063_002603 [Sporobolomyces koalae]|uniref:uncharacterized protein n=1 Tax=Sporobolomyces koalae TaxID=500713 RepID=UPI00317F747F